MLSWAVAFFIIAIIAAVLGFGGIAPPTLNRVTGCKKRSGTPMTMRRKQRTKIKKMYSNL